MSGNQGNQNLQGGGGDAGSTLRQLEYTEINNNFRALADIRFKLLAIVPALGGVAVFLLTSIGFSVGKEGAPPVRGEPSIGPVTEWLFALAGSAFGFFVSLGIVFYDQRNSEFYNSLIHRAKFLERKFGLDWAPGSLRASAGYSREGGQFLERPRKHRRFLFILPLLGHDLALALVYAPLLGAWFFPGVYALLSLRAGYAVPDAKFIAAWSAASVAVVAFVWLVVLDWLDSRFRDEASHENKENPPAAVRGLKRWLVFFGHRKREQPRG